MCEKSTELIQTDITNSINTTGFTLTPTGIESHTELSIEPTPDIKLDDEWMKERNVIPDFLAFHRVPLDLWQELFDQVNDLWIDQMKSIPIIQYQLKRIDRYLNIAIGVFASSITLGVNSIFLRVNTDVDPQSEQNLNFRTIVSVWLFIIGHVFFRGVYNYFIHMILKLGANKIRIERKASDTLLFSSIGKLKQYNLTIEATRSKLEIRIKKSKECFTVSNVEMITGFHFSKIDTTSYTFSPHKVMNDSKLLFQDDFQLEWIQSRNEIPDFLKSFDVSLQMWQKWFDAMENLTTERITNFYPKYICLFNRLFTMVTRLFDCYMLFVVLYAILLSWNSRSIYMIDSMILFVIFITFCIIIFSLSLILLHVIKPAIHKRNDETENAWSSLIYEIQGEDCNPIGLNVQAVKFTMHRYITYTGTIGLHFSPISGGEDMVVRNKDAIIEEPTWCDDEMDLV
jgi:hypothetical protein